MATRPRASRANGRKIVRLGLPVALGTILLLTGCQAGDPSPHRAASAPGAEAPEAGDPDAGDPDAGDPDAGDPDAGEPDVGGASPSVRAPVDPRVTASVRSYEAYLRAQAADLPARARAFTDAVRAGDVARARKAYPASRAGWERIQSVAILLPKLDRRLDAEAEDFASTRDPAWTGWHRLEHILWTQNSTAGAAPYADRLDRDLQSLNRAVATLTITPKIMADSIERLAEEAIAQKLPGSEDRYSRTDLADLAANIQGAEAGYATVRPALVGRDAELTRQIERQFAAVDRTVGKYRTAAGYRPYEALSATDRLTLRAELTDLAETLAQMSGTLTR